MDIPILPLLLHLHPLDLAQLRCTCKKLRDYIDAPETARWLLQERYTRRDISPCVYNTYYLPLPGAEAVRDINLCLEESLIRKDLTSIKYFSSLEGIFLSQEDILDLYLSHPQGKVNKKQVEYILTRITLRDIRGYRIERLATLLGSYGDLSTFLECILEIHTDYQENFTYFFLDALCIYGHPHVLECLQDMRVRRYLTLPYVVLGITAKIYHPIQEKLPFNFSMDRVRFFYQVYSNEQMYELISPYEDVSVVLHPLTDKPGFDKYVLERNPTYALNWRISIISPYFYERYTNIPRDRYQEMYIHIITHGIWEKFHPLREDVAPYRAIGEAIRTLLKQGNYRRLVELSTRLETIGLSYSDYYKVVTTRSVDEVLLLLGELEWER